MDRLGHLCTTPVYPSRTTTPAPLDAVLTGGLVFTVVDLFSDDAEGDGPLDDLIVVRKLQTTREHWIYKGE